MSTEQIIALREEGVTTVEIGRRLGVSPGVIAGTIRRFAPNLQGAPIMPRPEPKEPRTLYQRCDALHARMDQVLAETKDIPGLRIRAAIAKGVGNAY